MSRRYRIIKEVVDSSGEGLVSAWVRKELAKVDLAKVEARFNQIELSEIRNPNWVKPYSSLKMWEIRLDSAGKALRFLCVEDGRDFILVVGCVKRGQIKSAQEAQALERKRLYRERKLDVRDYPLPQRPSSDVGKS